MDLPEFNMWIVHVHIDQVVLNSFYRSWSIFLFECPHSGYFKTGSSSSQEKLPQGSCHHSLLGSGWIAERGEILKWTLVLFLLIHPKKVQRISDVFRSLYHYEVREISLPHRQKVKLAWPWVDESIVDERDLQIMYYLGSTMTIPSQGNELFNIEASPARQLPWVIPS